MGKKTIEIPHRCGVCIYLSELPAPDPSFTLFACSHQKGFDKNAVPLFVMPSESPPELCPFVMLQAQKKAKLNIKGFRVFLNRIFNRSGQPIEEDQQDAGQDRTAE